MTTDRDVQRDSRLRKAGAALVIAAGALLVVLSIIGGLTDDSFDWPVYAVLALASLALLRLGVQNWRRG